MLRNRKTHLISLFLLLFITACTTTNKPGGVYHCVKKGDTLWKISQLYNCKSSELAEVNNLPDTNIEAGSVLFIPYATNAMSTKPGKTPSNKTHDTVKPKTSSTVQKGSRKNIKKDEPSASKNVRLKSAPVNKSSKPSLIWPANGKVSSKFGTYNGMRHNGIQIKGKDGSSVLASANGAVIHSANIKYYGETIIIKHSSTYSTVYSNLKERVVQTGHTVKKGDKIGLLGKEMKTGKSYLYFEVRYKNRAKNPIYYLPRKK